MSSTFDDVKPPEITHQFTSYIGKVEVTLKDRTYGAYISLPPASASLDDLKTALETNRQIIQQAQVDLINAYHVFLSAPKNKPIPLNIASATQNALVAHLNINVIIPQINVRSGTKAVFSAAETLPVQLRIESMRTQAELQAMTALSLQVVKQPPTHPPIANPYGSAILIVLAIIMVFSLFSFG